jgi:hypothetical protein
MSDEKGVKVEKPVSVWKRPLTLDFGKFMKSLTDAAISGVTQDWGAAAKAGNDGLAAVGLSKESGQVAWLLIFRALTQSALKLPAEVPRFALKPDKKRLAEFNRSNRSFKAPNSASMRASSRNRDNCLCWKT